MILIQQPTTSFHFFLFTSAEIVYCTAFIHVISLRVLPPPVGPSKFRLETYNIYIYTDTCIIFSLMSFLFAKRDLCRRDGHICFYERNVFEID